MRVRPAASDASSLIRRGRVSRTLRTESAVAGVPNGVQTLLRDLNVASLIDLLPRACGWPVALVRNNITGHVVRLF